MSARDALVVTLPEDAETPPHWMRVVDGAMVKGGKGAEWLPACGLSELPSGCTVMLVPPVGLTALHWIAHPDMPARQGRAAARIEALSASIGPADTLVAAANENDDAEQPHLVAVAARTDMQHWLLWAQHHGLDPDMVVPAPLLLPEPEQGYSAGTIGGVRVLRGRADALAGDAPLVTALAGDAPIAPATPEAVNRLVIAALETPPLNLRQGDFAKRTRRSIDRLWVQRVAIWLGFILLASLLIALISIIRYNSAAASLDAESVAVAAKVLPSVTSAEQAEADLDARLAQRGAGPYIFSGPLSGLFTAMQANANVSLTKVSRGGDGLLSATLAAPRAEDINVVLLALQASGFTITATSSADPSGRMLADITVRP
jgi:general secretion pathway protein L